MSERLLQLETDLRTAVRYRRYAEVERIAAEFCAQSAAEWRSFPRGDPRARPAFDRMCRVLEWARLTICVSRASLADELRRLLLANQYLRSGPAANERFRFDL